LQLRLCYTVDAELSEHQENITIQVQPSARRNEVLGFKDNILHVKIAAPPVKGKANKELVLFLSQLIGMSKSSINIKSGLTSRRKVIAITGLDRDQIVERLKLSGS
jgi:uncharacterized protein (TIGR00251 family)